MKKFDHRVSIDKMDSLLRRALAPDTEPAEAVKEALRKELTAKCKDDILDFAREAANPAGGSQDRMEDRNRRNETEMKQDIKRNIKWNMKKKAAVAAAAFISVAAVSVTGAAASKYLSREDVIEQMGKEDARQGFESGSVLEVYQTKEAGDYLFTLYEIAVGGTLEEWGLGGAMQNGDVREGGTYAVMAIARKDGSPMPAIASDEYRELEFFVSPLIQGLEPWEYNLASMGGNYGEMERDGVLYRVIECDDISVFADRKLYLCVNESLFYNKEAFVYHETDGTITRNEAYEGINLLFELPIDAACANAEKAAEYLAAFDKPAASARTETEEGICPIEEAILRLEREKGLDVKRLIQIPAENLISYGNLIEESVKTVTVTEEGRAQYSFVSEEFGWSMNTAAESLKRALAESPDGKIIRGVIRCTCTDEEREEQEEHKLLVNVVERETDGTIKAMTYRIAEIPE